MNKSLIRSLLAALIALLILHESFSQGITVPRTPSPAATFSQTIGISTVTVKYSRPRVNNREVWGKLVPYGWNVQGFGSRNSAPWRAGANENTTIEFSHDGMLEGQAVPKGTYGLFFVINADNTGEVILSKEYRSWGSFFYDPAKDLLRAKIQLRDVPHTELLTYDMINLNKNSGELVLNWEKKQFPVKVEFEVDKIVMANAEEELKGPIGFNFQGPASAANYALANKVNTDRALAWIDQAITQQKNFNTMRIKAGLLRQAGRNEGADKLLVDAMAIATENELNVYGYQLLNQGDHDKAIEVLTMKTQRFQKSDNCWDILG